MHTQIHHYPPAAACSTCFSYLGAFFLSIDLLYSYQPYKIPGWKCLHAYWRTLGTPQNMSCPLLRRSQLAATFYMAILTCPAEEQNKHHSTSKSSIIIANNEPIHQPRSQIYPSTVAISTHPKINWMYKHNIQMYPTFPMYIGYIIPIFHVAYRLTTSHVWLSDPPGPGPGPQWNMLWVTVHRPGRAHQALVSENSHET